MAIKVLIIDDSALVREVLRRIFAEDARFDVVGSAIDPVDGWAKIKALKPDVITLDVEMPKMDGVSFLENLMKHHPMPVVMVSTLTEKSCDITLRALEAGAVDYVTKPKLDVQSGTFALADELRSKVLHAASAKVQPWSGTPRDSKSTRTAAPAFNATHKVIAIGASTGGTQAIREVLTRFPADAPGVVVVQHMPEDFTAPFAKRLDELCLVRVSEAKDGDPILAGHVLVARGGQHIKVVRKGAAYSVAVGRGAPVSGHCPSVDVLFASCARQLGQNAVGVLLTGMGEDGGRGMLELKEAGGHTIAQDEATSVVFGMPKAAITRGGATLVLPLGKIAEATLHAANAKSKS